MDAAARAARIVELAAEVVSPNELGAVAARAAQGEAVHAYIGFEPSGTAHVGWMVCTDMVRRLLDAGFQLTILLADWHAQINDKLGGDLAAIQRCGRYMEEAFEALGVPRNRVTYRYANEFAKDPAYWALVVNVMRHTTLARMRRAMTILGRKEEDADADMSKFLYPAMQVADIFHMGIDVAYGGLDQRHAHMLARDVAPKIGMKSPVAIHTPLVPSLKAGQGRMEAPAGSAAVGPSPPAPTHPGLDLSPALLALKMSKSDPDSGIFIHDAPEDIARKLKGAHCPAREVDGNPVFDLLRLVVWPRLPPGGLMVRRPAKFGGDTSYATLQAVADGFTAGTLHPMDLKTAVAAALTDALQPVRDYFAKHPENLAFVQGLRTTR